MKFLKTFRFIHTLLPSLTKYDAKIINQNFEEGLKTRKQMKKVQIRKKRKGVEQTENRECIDKKWCLIMTVKLMKKAQTRTTHHAKTKVHAEGQKTNRNILR